MGQQIAYLNSDYIGAASRFLYGRKGDKVEVLKIGYDDMVHVNNSGTLFYIKKSQLSFEAIEAQEEVKQKTIKQNLSQQTLF